MAVKRRSVILGQIIGGTIEGESVAFLPAMAWSSLTTPEVPFRANIYAMKLLGVERILSASAVGSLQEKYAPLDMVIPDQFFDRTRARARESTFFGEGIVAHIAFAHPVCKNLADVMEESCKATEVKAHRGGTTFAWKARRFRPGRIQCLSIVGHGRYRHDKFAGSQARERG